mmetsp:Transcript_5463/g.9470  ORF Transcript_5463/g.9470 Transcript_5463/m.9470 type:complete len:242 (-) Transcript_5463:666-1391(-)
MTRKTNPFKAFVGFWVALAKEDKTNVLLFFLNATGFFFAEVGIIVLPRGNEYNEVPTDSVGLPAGIAAMSLLVALLVVVGSGARHNRILLSAFGFLPMTIVLTIYGAHLLGEETLRCRKVTASSVATYYTSCTNGTACFMFGAALLAIAQSCMLVTTVYRRESIREKAAAAFDGPNEPPLLERRVSASDSKAYRATTPDVPQGSFGKPPAPPSTYSTGSPGYNFTRGQTPTGDSIPIRGGF